MHVLPIVPGDCVAVPQGMFPAINVTKAKLSSCQRVVLLAHNKDTGACCCQATLKDGAWEAFGCANRFI